MLRATALSLFVLLFGACTNDFEEINTNPNGPTAVQPELLFRQVIYGYGNDMGREGFTAGALLGQHLAMTDFNLFDRHDLSSPQEGGDPWPILYTALRDNESVLELSRTSPAAAVYEGPALVMKAYLTMTLTDLFGDVPYSEAFNARRNEITRPAYDSQESIYVTPGGILDNLERAVAVMDAYSGVVTLGGDLLYGGDLEGWVRFANSLRIKALMRIADRNDPSGAIQQLVDEGRMLTTNAQNATFQFADSPPNSFPLAEVRDGIFNVFLMSRTAEDVLAGLEDPRVGVHYLSNQDDGEFAGIQNGILGGSSVAADTFARPGLIWRERTGELAFNYLTAWETDLLLAEAALRGFLDADARPYYEAGVTKAFAYWSTPLPDGYLTSGPAAYDAGRALEQIITQKWIAGIGNGYESWIEWRRTGFPALQPVAASLNGEAIPVRMPYPNEEQALNFEAFSVAAEATQGNSVNARVWWDTE